MYIQATATNCIQKMKDKYSKYIRDGVASLPYGLKIIESDAFFECTEIKKVVERV